MEGVHDGDVSPEEVAHNSGVAAATKRSTPDPDPVVAWLLDGDPAIGWQTLRDLVGAPDRVAIGRDKGRA